MEKTRYQIFVSSTYEDLIEERKQVSQAILELEHIPAGMELFPASDDTQWELIKKVIQESDYYAVIIAGRYGSVSPEGISYTEMEFDFAVEIGKPIIGFLHKDPSTLSVKKSTTKKSDLLRLESFRKKVQARHCRFWSTPEELGLVFAKSLINTTRTHPAIGWVRADRAKSIGDLEKLDELREEIESLKKQNRILQDKLDEHNLVAETIDPSDLANFDDEFELTFQTRNAKRKFEDHSISVRWNEIYATIAPPMDGFIVSKQNDLYNKNLISHLLADLVRSKAGDILGEKELIFSEKTLNTIIWFFKAHQMMYIGESKGGQYGWTLTTAGSKHLLNVLAVKKQNAASKTNT